MFTQDITLTTNTYASVIVRPTSTVRRVNGAIDEPRDLTISHDVAKSGRVSSAIIIDDFKPVASATGIVNDNLRALLKVQYSPASGRSNIGIELRSMLSDLGAFLSVPANVDKLLNQEH